MRRVSANPSGVEALLDSFFVLIHSLLGGSCGIVDRRREQAPFRPTKDKLEMTSQPIGFPVFLSIWKQLGHRALIFRVRLPKEKFQFFLFVGDD